MSVSIFTGTPVVPTFVIKRSPFSGLHREYNSLCSFSEINLVFDKSNTPDEQFFTDTKGIPVEVYFGVL
jgi:hypothetical protein